MALIYLNKYTSTYHVVSLLPLESPYLKTNIFRLAKIDINYIVSNCLKQLEIYLSKTFLGGFSREGNPLIILPDTHLFFEVLESDLHLVLKYFIQIIPMAKQVSFPT